MPKLSERELRRLIKGGETNTVELKVASPRPAEMAERLCGMANAQGGFIIIGVEDTNHSSISRKVKSFAYCTVMSSAWAGTSIARYLQVCSRN